jgi:hypothetical protein
MHWGEQSLKTRLNLMALALCGGLMAAPSAGQAAQSYDNCTGFITSLPTTITTQGTWCLDRHLSTAITSGAAITIAANNVTLDCNDFKIGGLAAGPATLASGIYAQNRLNLTIRQCAIRGFQAGINLEGEGGGHMISRNRLDQNLFVGIFVGGEDSRVEHNEVLATGGQPGNTYAYGIKASGDIVDNTVSGVYTPFPTSEVIGIHVMGEAYDVRGNRVRGILLITGSATGIAATGAGHTLADNSVSAPQAGAPGVGLLGGGGFCRDNTVLNFATPYANCDQSVGNLALPVEE